MLDSGRSIEEVVCGGKAGVGKHGSIILSTSMERSTRVVGSVGVCRHTFDARLLPNLLIRAPRCACMMTLFSWFHHVWSLHNGPCYIKLDEIHPGPCHKLPEYGRQYQWVDTPKSES